MHSERTDKQTNFRLYIFVMSVNKQEGMEQKSSSMSNILCMTLLSSCSFLCFWDWLPFLCPTTIMVHLSLARYVCSNISLALKLPKRHHGNLLVSARHPSAFLALVIWVNTWQRTWLQRNIKWLFSMSIHKLWIISKIKVDCRFLLVFGSILSL